jgi:hypothetical protein
MKTCIGFVRARNEASAWKPCWKRRVEGELLCASHREEVESVGGQSRGTSEHGKPDGSAEVRGGAKQSGVECGPEDGARDTAQIVASDLPDAGNQFGAEERRERNYLTEETCHS